jgi:murein DD-endopeptidase MepM/ murein hydrolase activator NlpD
VLDELDTADDCGCGPTERERRALWPSLVSRRGALALGALGVVALGAGMAASRIPAAFADSYPSWDDVQKAKANQAATQAEVTRIQGLISAMQADVANKQAIAKQKGDEFFTAQQAYYDAARRADQLQSQADAQSAKAKDAAEKAGAVAAQLYRNGGDDTTLKLFLSGSAATADDLLKRLGTMDKLLEANQTVYADAVTARDSAQSLSDQAKAARDERDKLQQQAQAAMVAAQQAAQEAQAALDAQNANLDTLNTQLAALKDTTAKTVAAYQAGVEERAREAAAAAAAAAQRAAEAAKNTGAGVANGSGWCRPSAGVQSSGFGPRAVQCSPTYCATSFHEGVDLAPGCGAPIYAASAGTVTYAGSYGGYGNAVLIDHGGGILTIYGHIVNGGIRVGYGQRVGTGQLIAYVGNTGFSFGCHLHYEIHRNGTPIDPVPFMRDRGISV